MKGDVIIMGRFSFFNSRKNQKKGPDFSLQKEQHNTLSLSKDPDRIEYKKRNAPTGHQYNHHNYLRLLDKLKREGDSRGHDEVLKLFEMVKKEIKQNACVSSDLSDEEYCNLAAWFAVQSCDNHGLSGYCVGKVFVDIKSVKYLCCLIFSMVFIERRDIYAFLLDKSLVKKLDTPELRELQKSTQIKLRIYVKLNPAAKTEVALKADEEIPFCLWDVLDEQFYAVVRLTVVIEEIEDGYPIDVCGYKERFELLRDISEIAELKKQLAVEEV